MSTSQLSGQSKPQINLMRGWPSPSLLPAKALKVAADKVLSDSTIFVPALQYGPDPGYRPLREEIARWLGSFYNVRPDPERICVTGGASQNIACVLQSFTDPAYTQAIWMVAPCYYLACPIFADSGFSGRMRAVREDDEGINLIDLEQGLRAFSPDSPTDPVYKVPTDRKHYRHIIYVVPTSSNPSGKTMTLARREGLVKLARKYDCLIICDDVYDFLQWPLEGEWPFIPPEIRLPRLCDIDLALGLSENGPDRFGFAISNGTFSKIVGPGVRTGWVEASPAFVYGLSQTGSTRSGGAPSQLSAALMWEMLASGHIDHQIDSMTRPALQRRHKSMLDAIDKYLAPFGVAIKTSSLAGSNIFGGYFVWLSLPEDYPTSKAISVAALEQENLIIGYGDMFEVQGDEVSARFEHYIRLSFSWEPEDVLEKGIERLGQVLSNMSHRETAFAVESRKGKVPSMTSEFK